MHQLQSLRDYCKTLIFHSSFIFTRLHIFELYFLYFILYKTNIREYHLQLNGLTDFSENHALANIKYFYSKTKLILLYPSANSVIKSM